MKLPEILITIADVKALMGDKFQFFEKITSSNIFCMNCTKGTVGMIIQEVYLSNLNDIIARGTCKECGGGVARVLETGDDPKFYEKAMAVRKARNN